MRKNRFGIFLFCISIQISTRAYYLFRLGESILLLCIWMTKILESGWHCTSSFWASRSWVLWSWISSRPGPWSFWWTMPWIRFFFLMKNVWLFHLSILSWNRLVSVHLIIFWFVLWVQTFKLWALIYLRILFLFIFWSFLLQFILKQISLLFFH